MERALRPDSTSEESSSEDANATLLVAPAAMAAALEAARARSRYALPKSGPSGTTTSPMLSLYLSRSRSHSCRRSRSLILRRCPSDTRQTQRQLKDAAPSLQRQCVSVRCSSALAYRTEAYKSFIEVSMSCGSTSAVLHMMTRSSQRCSSGGEMSHLGGGSRSDETPADGMSARKASTHSEILP
eukprot:scaffold67146_cov30-Tisochrysis_lutea.AAC.4